MFLLNYNLILLGLLNQNIGLYPLFRMHRQLNNMRNAPFGAFLYGHQLNFLLEF